MNLELNTVQQTLKNFELLVNKRLEQHPKYGIYIFCKNQADYINALLNTKGTIELEDEKKIHLGMMSVKEDLDTRDPELDEQIHKLTWSIGKLTGRIK